MAYSFSTILLSAQKTGNPTLIGTTLSGTGVTFLSGASVPFLTQNVVVVSLSTNDVGITFNPKTVTVGATSLSSFKISAYPVANVTVLGSVFTIPTAMGTTDMAVVRMPVRNVKSWNVFPYLSGGPTVTVNALSVINTTDVSDPELRRKWVLGYV
jgi:hypothetical protein